MKKSYEMDMCSGHILKKILIFSIPLMLSGVLQLLFNAADVIVVGRFAGSPSLAAVGSTTSLINLFDQYFYRSFCGRQRGGGQSLRRKERPRS